MADIRLTDANALLREMRCSGCAAYMLVMDAPTIGPEMLRPVAHWEAGGVDPVNGIVGNWKCSLCNETSLKDSPFCPSCGAKMEDGDA